MVVIAGRQGVTEWVDMEVRRGLERHAAAPEQFRIVVVIGPGAEPAQIPAFLREFPSIDFRDGHLTPERVTLAVALLAEGAGQAGNRSAYWQQHSPFVGERPFEASDSLLYFGRDAEMLELGSMIASVPIVFLVGEAGSGKTSLIRSGLIPMLSRGSSHAGPGAWRVATFRPRDYPSNLGGIVRQLFPESKAAELDIPASCTDPVALREALSATARKLAPPTNTRMLLVCDQLEEVGARLINGDACGRFIESLLAATAPREGIQVHLLFSVRAGFYVDCLQQRPELKDVTVAKAFFLGPMSPKAIRTSIQKRLALAGATDEAGLLDRILSDLGDSPGGAALVDGMLAVLWSRSPGKLTNADYTAMGGLRGYLTLHADAAYVALSEPDQALAKRIFLNLVQVGDGSSETRRRVEIDSLSHLGDPDSVTRVISLLGAEHLVHVTRGVSSNTVELSHEGLVHWWPRLVNWIDASREDLVTGRRFLRAADEWVESGKDETALLGGVRLRQAEVWAARAASAVPKVLSEYIEASRNASSYQEATSRRELERGQMRRRVQAASLTAMTLVSMGFAAWGMRTQSRYVTSHSRDLAGQAIRLAEKQPDRAFDLALEALRTSRTNEAVDAVLLTRSLTAAVLAGHTDAVTDAQFDPAARLIVTSGLDKTARVWEATGGETVAIIVGHSDAIERAEFSPDGRLVVTASADGTARVWDAREGKLVSILKHRSDVNGAFFSPDGARIVTASADDTARVWDARTGRPIGRPLVHLAPVNWASFSPDGNRIVTASADHTALAWDASTGEPLGRPMLHDGSVNRASFSPDGTRIVTASADRTARAWDAQNGAPTGTPLRHDGSVEWGFLQFGRQARGHCVL